MTLYGYQQDGIRWLLDGRTRTKFLWDDMGLGKTVQVLVALGSQLPMLPHLVICPVGVAYNWAKEAKHWAPELKVHVLHGKRGLPIPDDADLVVTTYDTVRRAPEFRALIARKWQTLVVDEAHYLKNPTAKRTQRILGKLTGPKTKVVGGKRVKLVYECIARHCARVWMLTGTPAPNNPSEVWSVLAGAAPEALEREGGKAFTESQFRDHFCQVEWTPFGPKVVGARNGVELRARMAPYVLRRRKTDHLQLPPVRWAQVALAVEELPAELRECEKKYAGMEVEQMLAAMKQDAAFSTWRRLCGRAKADAAADLLHGELSTGALDKVVVFAHHRDTIEQLVKELEPYGVLELTGALSAQQRAAVVEQFQTMPSKRVVVCQINAAGVGVTLTAAANLVFVEQSYVPGENSQAADRIVRIGQGRPVYIRVLTLAGSVDDHIAEALARKTAMIQQVHQ